MARIRSLKPRFWDSPDTARADLAERLLFMALWNFADDSGRGTANMKELEGFAFPNDDLTKLAKTPSSADPSTVWRNFRAICAGVQRAYGVTFYKVRGRAYFTIPSFKDHQSKDFKPDSRLPGPEEGELWDLTCEDAESETELPQVPQPVAQSAPVCAGKDPLDMDRDGDKDKEMSDPSGSNDSASSTANQYPAAFEKWWAAYPRKDGKRDALAKWRQAKKRNATEQDLIDGAIRYRDDPNRQLQYTKQPAKWLNGDCWLSEAIPAESTNNTQPIDWSSI